MLPDGTACVLKQAYDEVAGRREAEVLRLLGPPSVRLLAVRGWPAP